VIASLHDHMRLLYYNPSGHLDSLDACVLVQESLNIICLFSLLVKARVSTSLALAFLKNFPECDPRIFEPLYPFLVEHTSFHPYELYHHNPDGILWMGVILLHRQRHYFPGMVPKIRTLAFSDTTGGKLSDLMV